MAKEEDNDEKIKRLKEKIEQRGREVQELKKKVEELRAEISPEETQRTSEVDQMLKDVSGLLDTGFNIFGISGKSESGTEGRGLFGLIGDLVKLAEESKNVRKTIDIGGKKGVIEYSIRSGTLTDQPRAQRRSFARLGRRIARKSPAPRRTKNIQPPTEVIKEREPLVDVFDEKDGVKVTVELLGVEKNDIQLDLKKNHLTIRVDTPTKKYYKKVDLPASVEEEIVESTYRNSILEVKLKKIA